MLNSRRSGEYKHIILNYGNSFINIGFLSKEDRLDLAAELISDISNLIYSDFDSEEDFMDFIKENT